MEFVVATSFNKDIAKLKDGKTARKLETLILKLQLSNSLPEISGVKKMSGSLNAYRLRVGDYRVGFYLEDITIRLTAFAHRKDIYKKFP